MVVTGRKSIRAWGRTDADKTNENTPVEIVPQGDRLLIRTNHDRVPDNQQLSADLEVTIPKSLSVESRARVGDFEATDIAGDIELVTDRADVRLSRIGGNARLEVGRSEAVRVIDLKGKIDLQGRGSDVELENIQGQVTINGSYGGTLEFKNLAKPLQFEGTRIPSSTYRRFPAGSASDLQEITGSGLTGPVRVVTRSRDIKLEQFTHGLELDTDRGDVQLQPSSPVSAIEARSGNGRIDLVLPEKAAFDLLAVAERGEVVNDYGSSLQREREGRMNSLRGKVGEGPSIRLKANHGSVSVRREGVAASEIPEPPKPGRAPRPPKEPEVKM